MNLLLAVALLLQDKAAEETFNKIEEAIQKAKTLSFKYKFELAVNGQKRTTQGNGAVILKEGSKFNVTGALVGTGPKVGFELVSDGAKMVRARFGADPPTDLPSNMNRLMAIQIARLGVAKAFFFPSVQDGEKDKKEETDLKNIFKMSGLKSGEDDQDGKTLTYTLKVLHELGSADVKVWYDPKTFKLLKRTLGVREHLESPVGATLVETYEEFTLNVDVPDGTFTLPFDGAAVETLKKITRTIETAKTVSVKFHYEEESAKRDQTILSNRGTGQLLLKEGNLASFEMKWQQGGPLNKETRILSDGQKTWVKGFGTDAVMETPKLLNTNWTLAITRPGLAGGAFLIGQSILSNYEVHLGYAYSISALKRGPEEKGLASLTSKLTRNSVSPFTEDQVFWYDPKTFKPVKLIHTRQSEGGNSSMTETYDEFILGAVISDEKFKFPKVDK